MEEAKKYTDRDVIGVVSDSYENYDIAPGRDNHYRNNPDWTVVDVFDDEVEGGSGLYAYVIDTGDGDCIVVFRGTHVSGITDIENIIQDGVYADLGLLNNTETEQQRKARLYTQYIYDKYKDKYQNFTFMGHSLGGNLAEHAAITALPEMQERSTAISMDGPGFSNVYLEAHAEEIARMNGKLTRYQWSIVGALLNCPNGESYVSVDAGLKIPTDSESGLEKLKGLLSAYIDKHTSWDTLLNEKGDFNKGDPDSIMKWTEYASKIVDIFAKLYSRSPYGFLHSQYLAYRSNKDVGGGKNPQFDSVAVAPEEGVRYAFVVDTQKVRDVLCLFREKVAIMQQASDEIKTIRDGLEFSGATRIAMMREFKQIEENLWSAENGLRMFVTQGIECMEKYETCERKICEQM